MKRIVGIMLFVSYSSSIFSQKVDFDKIVPTTPEAAHLKKEVAIPVDISTGIPNISIPIYELKTGNISIPISLSYHASGIKVGQLSSSVGLGWGLNAGGGVQRTIRGKCDLGGWLAHNYTWHFADSLMNVQTSGANDYMLDNYDFSQDDYSFNFLGFGGSIFFDSTKTIRYVEKSPVKMEYFYTNGTEKFKATDISGYTYYFDSTDYSSSNSSPSNNPTNTSLSGGTSAWKLTKIQFQSTDTVKLDYEKYTVNYEENGADVWDHNEGLLQCLPGTGCETCGDDFPTALYHMISQRYFENSLIKQIVSRDTRIDFYYSNDANATVWKRKLDSIKVTSLLDNIVVNRIYFIYSRFSGNNQLELTAVRKMDVITGAFEETKFNYYETAGVSLPGISSRAKDMFGYFNNATNSSLIVTNDPSYTNVFSNANRNVNASTIALGTLRSVTHSTGGYSEFVYEPNKINDSTYGPGLRVKEVREYNALNGNLARTGYSYFGFHGQSIVYPYYMSAEIQQATYQRKYFSSDEPNNYRIPLGIEPAGYLYDSVIIRNKGTSFDLLTTNVYDWFVIYNGYKSNLKRTDYFNYNTSTSSYEIVKKDLVTNYQTIDISHTTPLLGVERPHLSYMASFLDGTYTCKQVTAGFYLQYSYTENLILKTKEQSITYQGGNPITTETRYYYANIDHFQPTRIVAMNSIDSTITTLKYPAEVVSSGLDPTGIYQTMVNNHFWGPSIIEETFDAQSNLLSKSITGYKQWTGLIAPETFQIGLKGNSPETRKQIKSYDLYGNIKEYSADNTSISFLWDYNWTIPISKVVNSVSADVAYTSFETNQSNWAIYGGTYSIAYSITGKKSLILSAGDSIKSLGHAIGDFYVTYWSRNGSLTVNGATASAGITRNGWTYYEHKVTGVADIRIGGARTIDELRLYPTKALMTTYAYDPLRGVTAISDANNNIKYFEYDGMNRLSTVRDLDRNIVGQNKYSLTQSGSGTMFYNGPTYVNFTKQGCGSGTSGSTVTYFVPPGRYGSSISQPDADAQALLEAANLGQGNANEIGACVVTCNPPCSYPTKRCINGYCIRGLKVYTSSTYNSSTGYYDCYYHYEWSDGFQSADFYEQSASSCL